MDDVHQITKMPKMGRMTWTTNMNQMSKWCHLSTKMPKWSAQHLLLEQCPSGQHSSAVGAVVGMSTMIPNMCPPYVQHAATSVSTKVGQVGQVIPKMMYHQCSPRLVKKTQMPSGVQVGQVSDSVWEVWRPSWSAAEAGDSNRCQGN